MNTAIILATLSTLGILNTSYLVHHKIRGTLVRCIAFPPHWCEIVQKSSYSKLFGVIPNSYLGLALYTVLLVLSVFLFFGFQVLLALQLLILAGFLFSLYFLYIQAVVLRAFCTWCVLSAIDFCLLFYIAFIF